LPDMVKLDYATSIAHKVLQAFREPFVLNGQQLYITTSIGIAIFPDDSLDADTLVKQADAAMYRAKEMGRDNFQRYTSIPDSPLP
jgi:diguanylate cyclase (GGDEF)-like protein